MESTTPKINYVITAEVVFADEEWVRFAGSQERIFFGKDHPFHVGEAVKITFERQSPNALPR